MSKLDDVRINEQIIQEVVIEPKTKNIKHRLSGMENEGEMGSKQCSKIYQLRFSPIYCKNTILESRKSNNPRKAK